MTEKITSFNPNDAFELLTTNLSLEPQKTKTCGWIHYIRIVDP